MVEPHAAPRWEKSHPRSWKKGPLSWDALLWTGYVLAGFGSSGVQGGAAALGVRPLRSVMMVWAGL